MVPIEQQIFKVKMCKSVIARVKKVSITDNYCQYCGQNRSCGGNGVAKCPYI